DMNVEDEYYKAIEDRDTAIMNRDKELKHKDEQLQLKSEQLQQKSEQLNNIVRSLYSNGMNILQIAEITGISKDEVAEILK
ncbi:MAG: hypothetical protein U0K26_01770, partial [Prevotella pectinovora]|nr:hypothetical protein [Prevotella pectinovora]